MQWGDGICGAGVDGRLLSASSPQGDVAEAFVGATHVLEHFSGSVLKTQVTGPVTMAGALRTGGVVESAVLETVTDQLLVRVVEHVEWIRTTVDLDRLVVVVDEPSLVALGTSGSAMPDPVRRVLKRFINTIDAEVGIHCCGDTDWGSIADLRPDWFSWDLSALGMGFLDGLDRIAVALGEGSRVIWGMVPTTSNPLPNQNVLVGRYGTAVANLVVAGAPFEALKEQAWFSPACGLAGLSVGDAEAVAERLTEVVEEVESGW